MKFEPEYEFESEYECIILDMNLGMDWDVSGFENPDPGLYPALYPDWDLDRNIIEYPNRLVIFKIGFFNDFHHIFQFFHYFSVEKVNLT